MMKRKFNKRDPTSWGVGDEFMKSENIKIDESDDSRAWSTLKSNNHQQYQESQKS